MTNEELLQQKLSGALRELDKLTEQLAQAQEVGTNLKAQLDEKKPSEQLAGWAIDRAIEVAKLRMENEPAVDITAKAASFTQWVMESSAKAVSL